MLLADFLPARYGRLLSVGHEPASSVTPYLTGIRDEELYALVSNRPIHAPQVDRLLQSESEWKGILVYTEGEMLCPLFLAAPTFVGVYMCRERESLS